ncbi:uncharacterized protein SCHCODRAFT_02051737 [Schizophyllum commune H4-8]|uniref:uncharacterized protein n=1 Tax=Schizophyllum commune (strain H4-8 / FGSC 9210) TaxID=578458 RepID=UPI00215E6C2E|nr:uncharacterized protein SCHCODRAFT_02051737 [Schizophyllum commune H4-8]KAI5888335.1 hypothetical protein SCHCODRAFT_02051737 [Schizophyllum commune H4-8]
MPPSHLPTPKSITRLPYCIARKSVARMLALPEHSSLCAFSDSMSAPSQHKFRGRSVACHISPNRQVRGGETRVDGAACARVDESAHARGDASKLRTPQRRSAINILLQRVGYVFALPYSFFFLSSFFLPSSHLPPLYVALTPASAHPPTCQHNRSHLRKDQHAALDTRQLDGDTRCTRARQHCEQSPRRARA